VLKRHSVRYEAPPPWITERHCVHNSPALAAVMWIHSTTSHPISQRALLILSFPHRPCFQNGLFRRDVIKLCVCVLKLALFVLQDKILSQYFNQLDAQNLFHNKFYFIPLHVSSTCAHHEEVKIALHSLWYHHTYRCNAILTSWWWAHVLETCRGMK